MILLRGKTGAIPALRSASVRRADTARAEAVWEQPSSLPVPILMVIVPLALAAPAPPRSVRMAIATDEAPVIPVDIHTTVTLLVVGGMGGSLVMLVFARVNNPKIYGVTMAVPVVIVTVVFHVIIRIVVLLAL